MFHFKTLYFTFHFLSIHLEKNQSMWKHLHTSKLRNTQTHRERGGREGGRGKERHTQRTSEQLGD